MTSEMTNKLVCNEDKLFETIRNSAIEIEKLKGSSNEDAELFADKVVERTKMAYSLGEGKTTEGIVNATDFDALRQNLSYWKSLTFAIEREPNMSKKCHYFELLVKEMGTMLDYLKTGEGGDRSVYKEGQ